MKCAFIFPAAILTVSIATLNAQSTTIRIRFLDGHTGKSVVHANSFIGVYPLQPHRGPIELVADANGEVNITVPTDSRVNSTVSEYPTCRHVAKAARTKGPVTFPVEKIFSSGIVDANNCSHFTTQPIPGELVLFVRPLHWRERLSD
jgi:hypothetical protein